MLNRIAGRLAFKGQMSESLVLSLLLSLSGGFQDAYTYVMRGHVFANAQTGNIVLMSSGFISGEWMSGLRYLLPVSAFAAGVFFAESIRHRFKNSGRIHWRQFVLLFEILAMLAVGFLPKRFELAANIIVSFACAMQVQSFRKVCGHQYASTMCIGNLRSGTEELCAYIRTGNKPSLKKTFCYFAVIFSFAVGAGVGVCLSGIFKLRTIWFCCFVLAVCFLLMLCCSENAESDM